MTAKATTTGRAQPSAEPQRPTHRLYRLTSDDLDPHRNRLAQQRRQGLQPQLRCGALTGPIVLRLIEPRPEAGAA